MQVIESVNSMQETAVRLRTQGKLIGLVATSGSIHAGHLSLIEKAKESADVVVVSVFVNEKEFGPSEDFKRYPHDREGDLVALEAAGVDIAFVPAPSEIYPDMFSSKVMESVRGAELCGITRPHYFSGACTLYVKLFNVVRPDQVVMGRKDIQLASVIRKLVEDLSFPVEVVTGGVVRDPDGMAVSGRNRYLNDFQRRDAVAINGALGEGQKLIDNGIRNVDRVLAEVTHHITQLRRLRVIYVAAVDVETMKPMREIELGRTLIMTAVWCDEVRLTDNILV